MIISQLPQHFKLPFSVIFVQLSHMLPEKIFSIVPQKHCFVTVEQIVSGSFDKMRWIRKEIYVTVRLCFRGMKVEGFVANFPWITMHLVQMLVGGCFVACGCYDFQVTGLFKESHHFPEQYIYILKSAKK